MLALLVLPCVCVHASLEARYGGPSDITHPRSAPVRGAAGFVATAVSFPSLLKESLGFSMPRLLIKGCFLQPKLLQY